MSGLLFLVSIFTVGYISIHLIFPFIKGTLLVVASFIIGSLLSIPFLYFISTYVTKSINYSVCVFYIVVVILIVIANKKKGRKTVVDVTLNGKKEWMLLISFFFFSWYIFWKSFSYDTARGAFLIASNVYADFGIHIPIIRSFSMGNNFPFEVPIYGNSNLSYHFMFNFFTGILEYLGWRIDIAFNTISSLSFMSLLFCLFIFARQLFKSTSVGVLSVLFFLFPSSLSSITFLKNNLSPNVLAAFWHNVQYHLYGPLGEDTISIYWNLNTFINQRHLIFSLAFVLLFLYILLIHTKRVNNSGALLLGICVGFLPFFHSLLFLAVVILSLFCMLLFPSCRMLIFKVLAIAFCIGIPQLLIIKTGSQRVFTFEPGFVQSKNFSLYTLSVYWLWNLGIALFTILGGVFLADKKQKKVFLLFFPLFLIPNVFRLSVDIASSHKLLNLWLLISNMYSAMFLVWLFKKRTILSKVIVLVSICFFISAGVIGFMVIKNDVKTSMVDYPHNAFLTYVRTNVPSNEVILTNGEIYDPVTIVGKKIYLGNIYHIVSYGGNPTKRIEIRGEIFSLKDKEKIKRILETENISYVVLYKKDFAKNAITVSIETFKTLFPVKYEDDQAIVFSI